MPSLARFSLRLALLLALLNAFDARAGVPMVNGCSPAGTSDATGQNNLTVTFTFSYTPNCVKIDPGTAVTFSGSFGTHPLQGGVVVSGMEFPDATSPIPSVSSGTSKTFTLTRQGLFGYYCIPHGTFGMYGAILVGEETVFTNSFDGP